MADQEQGNIRPEFNSANIGLNMDQTLNQIKSGTLTYALNATVENFDASSINYQNEPGNELCVSFPSGYMLIGDHFIQEKNKHIFFVVNPQTGMSQIGYMDNNDCNYNVLIEAACLNFNPNHPIHKVVHKITNCTTEIYWTDGINPRRYLDIENIPYIQTPESELCNPTYTKELNCNELKIQPNFNIPQLNISDITTGGDLTAGTYQFAVQYCDASGNPYTSYYSITNPTPIADTQLTTAIFDYKVGRSIELNITNLDTSGLFQYYNIAVLKTVNNITTIELVGTYSIENQVDLITYTGQNNTLINLSISDIFEKYPYYDIAQDLTAVQDVLVWDNLTSIDRVNYQEIASKIDLLWETYRIPASEDYGDELNATNLRGYLRDEVYAFEIVFLLKNGKQTDGFHIPGRMFNYNDSQYPDVPNTNADFIGEPDYIDPSTGIGYSAYWKIYNTANVLGNATGVNIGNATPHQYGEFAYWESIETYPCNTDVWGDLAGKPIRHHKFPDVLVSPIFENPVYELTPGFQPVVQNNAVYPIGVKVDIAQIQSLIQTSSSITQDQKDDIVGFKIVRGNRSTNKSIVAKGMLRNVATYERQDQTLYYPNYPYNDLNEDPFLLASSNSYSVLGQTEPWMVVCTESGDYSYFDPKTGEQIIKEMVVGQTYEFCSLTRPIYLSGKATIGPANYDVWRVAVSCPDASCYKLRADSRWNNNNEPVITLNYGFMPYPCPSAISDAYCQRLDLNSVPYQEADLQPAPCATKSEFVTCPLGQFPPNVTSPSGNVTPGKRYGRRSSLNDICGTPKPLPAITSDNAKYRQVFNSPETSFAQPFLGDILKLENVMFGGGKAHFVKVRGNAKYRLLSKEVQEDALKASFDIGGLDVTAVFTAYQAYLTIYINGITRKNYAYSFNSIASYDYYSDIDNNTADFNGNVGIKQRSLDLKSYMIPGVQNIGDDKNINNYQRESSIYIRTKGALDSSVIPLPFPSKTPTLINSLGDSLITDKSRFTISSNTDPLTGKDYCSTPEKEQDITSVVYYGSLKNIFLNQWGQLYSYETIDTGFQRFFNSDSFSKDVLFGGDTFISRFAYKTKLPFFLDNRVNGLDDSDIFYDELGNVAYPKFWHSARSILYNYNTMTNIISIKAHNFDCPSDPSTATAAVGGPAGTYRTFYDGKFYLFAYGIPNFYCESSYNTDLRQAFNDREGNFWPHVSTSIPDDWVQEEFTTIAYDNTYYYNVTFSKQNKENAFSHLPADWSSQLCFTNYPFRAIYSNSQEQNADIRVNNWLSYAPLALFDFPQNYGNLISLDGIQNKAILARFENKSLLYNNLLVMDSSNPKSAYLGGAQLFGSTPPIDFAETDLGYVGSQNKFLLKIPQGQITADAKRGQIFLIGSEGAKDITGFGSGVNRFMTDHLAFEILRYFPDVNIDNNYTGIGLHGVFDSKFDRVIITKLDYIPIDKDVKYDPITKEFYVESIVYLNEAMTTTTTTTIPIL